MYIDSYFINLLVLTNSIIFIISRCDILSPLGIYFRPFTSSVHDTKYHKRCTLSKFNVTLLDRIGILHCFLVSMLNIHTHFEWQKTTLTCGSSIPALQLNTWIHIKYKLLQYGKMCLIKV